MHFAYLKTCGYFQRYSQLYMTTIYTYLSKETISDFAFIIVYPEYFTVDFTQIVYITPALAQHIGRNMSRAFFRQYVAHCFRIVNKNALI